MAMRAPTANVPALPADLEPITSSVDRARVKRWFNSLDADLSAETFDSIWTRAGSDDATRAANLTQSLASALLGPMDANASWSRSSIPDALDDCVADPAHRADVVDLTNRTGAELAELAQGDIGYRYALANLQPFALTGNRSLFAAANADGRYDRFDPDTGEALISDAWLGDRGKFLAWKSASESGGQMAISGTEDWTFTDHSLTDSNGEPLTIELKTGAADAGTNQVVFGSDDGEIFKGVSGSDRMYGGGGDDVLRGGARRGSSRGRRRRRPRHGRRGRGRAQSAIRGTTSSTAAAATIASKGARGTIPMPSNQATARTRSSMSTGSAPSSSTAWRSKGR